MQVFYYESWRTAVVIVCVGLGAGFCDESSFISLWEPEITLRSFAVVLVQLFM